MTLGCLSNEFHRSMDFGTDMTADLWQVVLHMVTIYDGCILPLHTSGLDGRPLTSGVLGLLQLLKRASAFHPSIEIYNELMNRICKSILHPFTFAVSIFSGSLIMFNTMPLSHADLGLSDLPFRAVKSIQQNGICEIQMAACVAFLVSIVDFQKLFCLAGPQTCVLGDSLPDFEALIDLERMTNILLDLDLCW